jgi:transposase
MRKRNLGTPAEHQQIRVLLKSESEGWRKERLIALNLGFNDGNTVDDIAGVVCRNRATVQRWFSQFKKGGLSAVLERNYSDQGRPSGCTDEVQTYLSAGLSAARWNTVHQAKADLEHHFNQPFKYQTVWLWLKKIRESTAHCSQSS